MLSDFSGTGLEVMLAGASSAIFAQLFKLCWYTITRKELNFRLLVQTGGMPSSHSASMMAMATSVGILEGFTSTIFAVAISVTMVVMYDAAGLRQAAGKMAGILNKISNDFYMHKPEHLPERLRELLGHTPIEVLAGSLMGAIVAYKLHLLLLE